MRQQTIDAEQIKAQQGGLEKWLGKSVKIGFDTHLGGTEWMWLMVSAVKGRKLVGKLKSEPWFAIEYRQGQKITFKEDEIFAVNLV
ncbi:DUF2314 domain-containing protein [Frigoriglobus tundricola]|uniref:DUF2314 domain-containing protein n=1 Tax=Frigoriglobus tundricola TaxID=2774151 RepID=A0A6M5YGU2_9BACT|nr:DUF2314 domain-containing protein [Frigoriglobus tundricola]QJW93245.1 hypothetical protein FTUN_0750 [Frigoriglobus tundricola]